jgi:perosamine synthetase
MIPIYKPYFTKKNLEYAHQAINSGWVSSQGDFLDKSKSKLIDIFGNKRIILTNNGTSATHLLAIALKYKHPHITRIIVPNNVYVAAWNSFLFDKQYQLIPIDSNIGTWNFDSPKMDFLIDENTAILVVHNIGNVVNVPNLQLRFPNTIILEDNCEGFLGKYNGRYTGTESFASSTSFYGNKTITCGEGGAFMTNDDDVFDYINKVKSQGQSNNKFIHDVLGYNYRMTNIQASLLYGQLESLEEIKGKKHKIFNRYTQIFEDIKSISLQEVEPDTEHSEWIFGIRFNEFNLVQKEKMELNLFQSGIDTRKMFYPISSHKHISFMPCDENISTQLNHQCILIPSYPDLNNTQIEYITRSIKNYI